MQEAAGMNTCENDDKREFLRVDHETKLDFKVLNAHKLSSKKDIMSRNVSASGLLFRTQSETSIPNLSSVVWVKLDDKMMNICGEIENDLVMFDGGVFGRVVRIAEGEPELSYDIGVCFLRRKNMTEDDINALIQGLSDEKEK
jgi:c-di-GMP-binding flagellar brake protein YcgR